MTVTVYVPRDSSARAVGADEVAVALTAEAARRGDDIRIVRNGSRGMLWLEPFVEVDVDGTRVGYGPVQADDVTELLDAGLLSGGDHALSHGPVDEIDWLTRQDRLTYARMGVIDPLDLADYEAHGGLVGLRKAVAMAPQDVVDVGLGVRAARPWRRRLPGRPQVADRPRRAPATPSTSAATPTRATAAPSPTAC